MKHFMLIGLIAVCLQTYAEDGLKAYYFNNTHLGGAADVATKVENIDFEWGLEAPDSTILHDFSARYTAYLIPNSSGKHTIKVVSDDGVRIWLNEKLVLDHWQGQGPSPSSFDINLTAGEAYEFELEFFDDHLGAYLKVYWTEPGESEQIIPTDCFRVREIEPDNLARHVDPFWNKNPDESFILQSSLFSYVSPAYVQGIGSPDSGSILISNDYNNPSNAINYDVHYVNDHGFYANVPLKKFSRNRIVASGDKSEQKRNIIWLPYFIDRPGGRNFTLRQGDALLLSSFRRGQISVVPYYGGEGSVIKMKRPFNFVEHKFEEPGYYSLEFRDHRGRLKGEVRVTVVGVRANRTACELLFSKPTTVPCLPSAELVNWYVGNPNKLELSHLHNEFDDANFMIKPLDFGKLVFYARIGGQGGPIITHQEIDEFTLKNSFEDGITGWVDEYGFAHANYELTMTPVIPYLDVQIEFIVPNASIEGLSTYTFSASAFDEDGKFNTVIDISNSSFNYTTCHRLNVIHK